MEIRNFTPFPEQRFDSLDLEGNEFGVIALKGTFEITEKGTLRPAVKQDPLTMSDQYYGVPGETSVRKENDIAPFKQNTDIHVEADAHAPGGKPSKSWTAGVRVGKIEKKILVTGPRQWRKCLIGWELTKPEPRVKVPIRYELAFGGRRMEKDKMKEYGDNPVGLGFVNNDTLNTWESLYAPQIMSPEDPTPKLNGGHRPEGFGPLAPGWKPRLAHAGDYDLEWKNTRWPMLPKNFDYRFYNSAHPDLVYPGFVRGDEDVSLFNLTPESKTEFRLPDFKAALLVRKESGALIPIPAMLDTIHICAPEKLVYLVWRGNFPLKDPVRVLEVRMKVPT